MNTEQIVTEQLIDLINKYLSNNKLHNDYYYKAFNKAYCCYQNLNNKILIAEKKQSKDYYQLDILICKDTEKLSEVEPLVIIEVKNKEYFQDCKIAKILGCVAILNFSKCIIVKNKIIFAFSKTAKIKINFKTANF